MKVIAYIHTDIEDEQERLATIQQQKVDIIEYCKHNGLKVNQCLLEPKQERPGTFPVLFSLLSSQDNKLAKIVIYSRDIFNADTEFKEWLLDEIKNRKIKVDFVHQTPEEKRQESIEEKMKQLLTKVKTVSSLPAIIAKILRMMQDEKSSAAQLAKIIQYDLGLTSKILQLVNSPFYGFPKQISSIQHGIAILGFSTIKGLVISSGIHSSFKKSGIDGLFDYTKFWLHTTLCATLATDFTRNNANYDSNDKEEVFSASILHDIGKLILNQYDNLNYQKVLANEVSPIDYEKLILTEGKYCILDHTQVGQIVTDSWNLPEIISKVALYHHDPLNADENIQKLAAVVYTANILSTLIIDKIDPKEDMFNNEVLAKYNLGYDNILKEYMEFKENPKRLDYLKRFFE